MNINKYVCTGRLTKDPELKALPSGTSVCELRLAVDGMGRGREVGYINVSVFGKAGEAAAQYLGKGWLVAVDGRLDLGQWETEGGEKRRDYSVVGSVEFLTAPRPREAQELVPTPSGENKPKPARKRKELVPAQSASGPQLTGCGPLEPAVGQEPRHEGKPTREADRVTASVLGEPLRRALAAPGLGRAYPRDLGRRTGSRRASYGCGKRALQVGQPCVHIIADSARHRERGQTITQARRCCVVDRRGGRGDGTVQAQSLAHALTARRQQEQKGLGHCEPSVAQICRSTPTIERGDQLRVPGTVQRAAEDRRVQRGDR
jgi:single-strand DNA-binding protein